jgi:hypothetical protein
MKTSETISNTRADTNLFRAPIRGLATALAVFGTYFVLNQANCRADPSGPSDQQGVEVLTRGPVHEAFAGVVAFNPQPGVVVPKTPPAAIEEVPPDERPEGTNVTWIPGYWAWDDERNDFLWVSGVWRALPPGRQWVAGYWAQSPQGFQWTAGYWADAKVIQTTYLPPPPASVEVGPNIAAPSADYGWTPGCWVWYQGRYAWQPGYWVAGRSDWDWSPSYYVWTPRGYVFVDGYWDYTIQRRGVLFAPVYFSSGVYTRQGYYYSPNVVINVGVFSDDLFIRPSYQHYYYGDYYAASYSSGGFYAAFAYQSGHHGYDPIYAHQRWENRHDQEWEHHVEATYQNRRDHEDARPPRTWSTQQSISPSARSKDNNRVIATPLDQVTKGKAGPVRYQPVPKAEKQQINQRDQEVRQARDQRRTLESAAVEPAIAKPGQPPEPATVKLPKSPIVAKSSDQLGRGQAPPSPHKTPQPDLKVAAKSATYTPAPTVDQNNRQPVPPQKKVQQPAWHEPPPPAQQPTQPQAKPEPGSAKEKPSESDKGEPHNEHNGQQDKDEEQQTPTSK